MDYRDDEENLFPQNMGDSAPMPRPPAPSLNDILANAQSANKAVYGDYTPENRQELVQHMLEKQNSLPSAVGQSLAGIGDAISRGAGQTTNYLQDTIKHGQDATSAAVGNFDQMQKQKEQAAQTGLSLEQMDPTSPASKALQTAARPILAAAGLKQQDIASLPAGAIDQALKSATSFADAKAKLAQVAATKDYNMGLKHDQQQDRLEQQAKQGVMNLRGDKSLARVEEQRDGAISAYNLIDQLKKENRMPSKLEYYDLLGQMWKARTGQGPTDQAIRDLDSQTFKGDLSKAVTYFTGHPAGATTRDVLANIQQFAKHSGELADKLHEGYMAPHMMRPKDLDSDRWDPIAKTSRGISFADSMKAAPQADGSPDHSAAIQWAKANPNDPRASAILQRATMALGHSNGL